MEQPARTTTWIQSLRDNFQYSSHYLEKPHNNLKDNFPLLLMRFVIAVGIHFLLEIILTFIKGAHPLHLSSYLLEAVNFALYIELTIILLFPYFQKNEQRPVLRTLFTNIPPLAYALIAAAALVFILYGMLREWVYDLRWNGDDAFAQLNTLLDPFDFVLNLLSLVSVSLLGIVPLVVTFVYYKRLHGFTVHNRKAFRKKLLASFLLFFATVQTYFLIYRLLGAFLLDLSFFGDWQELINSLISIALFLLLYSRIQLFIAATLVFPYIDDASLQERPGTTKKPNDQLLDQI